MNRYRKTYAAALAALCTTIAIVWDGIADAAEAIALVSAWGGVGAVYLFPNDDETLEGTEAGAANPAWITAIAAVVIAAIAVLYAIDTGLIGN